jgi:hypothetical protein
MPEPNQVEQLRVPPSWPCPQFLDLPVKKKLVTLAYFAAASETKKNVFNFIVAKDFYS